MPQRKVIGNQGFSCREIAESIDAAEFEASFTAADCRGDATDRRPCRVESTARGCNPSIRFERRLIEGVPGDRMPDSARNTARNVHVG